MRCTSCSWTFDAAGPKPTDPSFGTAPTIAATAEDLGAGPGFSAAAPQSPQAPPPTLFVGGGGQIPSTPPASLYAPQPSPFALPPSPYRPPNRVASLEPHLKVVAIFNIILGVFTFGWAFIWIAEIVLFATGQIETENHDEMANVFTLVFIVVLLILSIAAGIVHVLAGIKLLSKKPGGRVIAIIAGIAGACSIWTCCLWPLGLGFGIYTLSIVLRAEALELLE